MAALVVSKIMIYCLASALFHTDLRGLYILGGIIVALLVAIVIALIWRFGLKRRI
jgi:hypothetical protein